MRRYKLIFTYEKNFTACVLLSILIIEVLIAVYSIVFRVGTFDVKNCGSIGTHYFELFYEENKFSE